MNLKQLEYFVHVAEQGSFSKAARLLEVAQPALSRQVRQLEVDLRETLLLRHGRGVALTEAGHRLLAHGQAILQSLALAREDMESARDTPVGRITIGLPPIIGRQLTLPLVEAFRQRLPRAQLVIVEGLSSHVVEWIGAGRVDVGLLYNPEAQAGLDIRPVLREPLCLIARAPRPVAGVVPQHGPLPLRELSGKALIVPERSHVIRRLLETQAAMMGLKLSIAWEVSSVGSIIDLVCAGLGHAVLTASAVAASGRADVLVARPLVDPPLTSVLCLAVASSKRPGPLMRQASQLLEELAASLPQGHAEAR